MNRFRTYSMQTKLMFFFNSIAVLLFLTVGLLFYRSTEGAINDSKRRELATLSYETANKIDRFLFERYGDIQVMAASPLLREDSIRNNLKLDYLESVRTAYKTYDYIFITDRTGKIVVQSGNLDGDQTYLAWLPSVLKGTNLVSDFTNVNGSYGVYFASPIQQDNRIIGAVVERMNIKSVSDIVKAVTPGRNGYAYLYQINGNAMLQPKGYKPKAGLPLLSKKTTILNMEHDGTPYVSAGYPLKRYATQSSVWHLMVEEPYSEAFSVAANLRGYTIAIVAFSIFALFILGIFLSKLITAPIRRLVEETQRVALGNLGQGIAIESRDEIGSLAVSINTLLENLKSTMQQVLDISGEAASLEEIRQYSDNFFESLPSGILIADSSGKITSINKTAVDALIGFDPPAPGTRIDAMLDTGLKELATVIQDGLVGQIMYKKHIIRLKSNALEVPILLNTNIQKDAKGGVIGVIAAFKPVAEIAKLEASLTRARNLASLGELSAGMAHEIRNPLTSVKGYAQYIRSELTDPELIADIDIIINEVNRLNGILDRFLSFARPKELKLKKIDLNQLVKDVIRLVSLDLDYRIVLLAHYDSLPLIDADPDQLEQSLLNLVVNSIQAMPQGGQLQLKTRQDPASGHLLISVRDTGPGIAEQDIDKIFEPFYTTKDKGTGLGLAIASRIIEAHGGILEVISAQNTGTVFTVRLPVSHNGVAAIEEMQVKQ